MKKAGVLICIICIISGCNILSTEGNIKNRWDFSFSNAPLVAAKVRELRGVQGIDPYQQVFLGSKFIFRSNNEFDLVLFNNYYHGNWQLNEAKNALQLTLPNYSKPILFQVDSITNTTLQLRIDSSNFSSFANFRNPENATEGWFGKRLTTFKLTIDPEHYSNTANDIYSIDNNKWRVKPLQPETQQQLKLRIRNHLDFLKLLFDDAMQNDRDFVTYNWFVSPLTPASNGIGLKNYRKVKAAWENCFYDTLQAKAGYDILWKAFDKEIKFPEQEENKYKRNSNMIGQIIKNMD
jgi:hypothetical protein